MVHLQHRPEVLARRCLAVLVAFVVTTATVADGPFFSSRRSSPSRPRTPRRWSRRETSTATAIPTWS